MGQKKNKQAKQKYAHKYREQTGGRHRGGPGGLGDIGEGDKAYTLPVIK